MRVKISIYTIIGTIESLLYRKESYGYCFTWSNPNLPKCFRCTSHTPSTCIKLVFRVTHCCAVPSICCVPPAGPPSNTLQRTENKCETTRYYCVSMNAIAPPPVPAAASRVRCTSYTVLQHSCVRTRDVYSSSIPYTYRGKEGKKPV